MLHNITDILSAQQAVCCAAIATAQYQQCHHLQLTSRQQLLNARHIVSDIFCEFLKLLFWRAEYGHH